MKWLTQLTDEWGEGEDAQNNGETASRAEGGRQPLEESRTVLIMSLQDLWISAAFLVVPACCRWKLHKSALLQFTDLLMSLILMYVQYKDD